MESKHDIWLTGSSGGLGVELLKLRSYLTTRHKDIDITDEHQVHTFLYNNNPKLIVHAAAYTNTSLPDKDPEEAYKCYLTNVIGTRNIVKYAKCSIIFISTETVLHPYNFYAITKLQAENEIKKHHRYTIIRTNFRDRPFEYNQAFTDMLTIGDYIDVIAKKIDKVVDLPTSNKTVYVGTSLKTAYELAEQTKPNVQKTTIEESGLVASPMIELLNI